MNQVKLSGFLLSDPVLRSVGSRGQMAVASLQFSRSSEAVSIVAVAARVRQIVDFRKGDAIAITGRLSIYPGTQRFVILLDVAGKWTLAPSRRGFEYDADKANRAMREIAATL